jgi:hypothetical protein
MPILLDETGHEIAKNLEKTRTSFDEYFSPSKEPQSSSGSEIDEI